MTGKNKKIKSKFNEKENVILSLINKYISYWPLFILIGLVFITSAFIYIRYTNPKYEASATLLIKDEKKGTDDSKILESLNIINSKKIIENEIEVLQSRKILDSVVKHLSLYAPIYIKGRFRNISAYEKANIKIEIFNPDSIMESKDILLSIPKNCDSIFLNRIYVGLVNNWNITKYGNLKISRNKNSQTNLNDRIQFSLIPVKDITEKMSSQLTVEASNKLSSIINLIYKDEDPKRAEDILNNIIEYYINATIDQKNNLAKKTLQFVEKRLNVVSGNLDSIEQNIESYKKSIGRNDISSEGQLYLQNVSNNDQELAKINIQLSILNEIDSTIKNKKSKLESIIPYTNGLMDPSLSNMINDLNNKELEYEKLKKTVAENNPILVSLKDQINKIKPGITDNLKNQRQNLDLSKSNLNATNKNYNNVLSTMPLKEKRIIQMSRDQNIKNNIYEFLIQKKEESELTYASTIAESLIINSPLSSKYPISPNKPIIYLLTILGSLIIGIILINTKEVFNNKILYRKDLDQMTSIPVIGEITFKKNTDSYLITPKKRSLLSEEFRKIRSSLHYLGINEVKNKILVTSSIPGEGKSFVTSNLGISNAMAGKKVLLIDLDLYKPGLSKIFGIASNEIGISDYLCNNNIDDNIIIREVSTYENLYIIPSGKQVENPSEILLNGRIAILLKKYEQLFDLILIDTAPTVMITDAYELSKLCNTTIYVVRHNYTPKNIIKRLDKTLHIYPIENPAIIFNAVSNRGFIKNKFAENYGYEYGKLYTN